MPAFPKVGIALGIKREGDDRVGRSLRGLGGMSVLPSPSTRLAGPMPSALNRRSTHPESAS